MSIQRARRNRDVAGGSVGSPGETVLDDAKEGALYGPLGSDMMMEDRSLKRLRKKARKGMRGWPVATIAFYGPNLSQATKVAVGIVPSENAEPAEMRDWKVDRGDIRNDAGIAW